MPIARTLNRAEMAELASISLPTLDKWVKAGCPILQRGSKGVESKFNPVDVFKWRATQDRRAGHPSGEIAPPGEGEQGLDDTVIRRRTAIAGMLQAELELEKARGNVAPIDEFEKVQARIMATIKAKIMNVPQRVVLSLLGETDETTFKRVLKAELSEALEQAATSDIDEDDEDFDE